ncbi:glycosyltransferase [Tautonia sociabilis]|uniref:Glycosyltransferase family 1 protein n=1 Tax=Tautonia sociabilis TaxID=2080755 RepID=A0A432MFG2_9BACT|nr:glycosyltransferase family 1 protein [Tautonia sociabilis]RUL84934.1 glycosyltransferase family 1 protein [Tautonia sociabilis]
MAVKRIGIALPVLGISGGINIVLNWGAILARAGYRVELILPASATDAEIPFLPERDCRLLHVVALPEARRRRYHAAVATWWATIPWLADLEADHYAWFMQAVEGQFFGPHTPEQADFAELVSARMNVITTAHWLQRHVERHLSPEPRQTFCVVSGLDKELWRPMSREPLRPGGRPVRFLVEGPPTDPRKNVVQTVRMLEGLGLTYSWVGAIVDPDAVGPRCRRIEAKVPYRWMPSVYADSDVLVKASNSEGMFGPPLEMFATGGTSVSWDVQGAEEYMADRHNCRLTPMNSWPKLAEAALELAENPGLVRSLQERALATAEAWPTWEDQADQILHTIESLAPCDRSSLVRRVARTTFRGDAALDEARRRMAWLESEVARRDAQIAGLWAEADARGRAIEALQARLEANPLRRAARLVRRPARALLDAARPWIGRRALASYRDQIARAFRPKDQPLPAPEGTVAAALPAPAGEDRLAA